MRTLLANCFLGTGLEFEEEEEEEEDGNGHIVGAELEITKRFN